MNPEIRNMTNPNGAEFQVANFAAATGIKLHGKPSFDHSFYPPYSWQIMSCGKCQAHLGWKFQKKGARVLDKVEDKMVCDGEMETVRPPPAPQGDPLTVLNGKCTVSRQGWWTFQWCHRKEIRQYHTEQDGKRGQDWSLGRFNTKGAKTKKRKKNSENKFDSHVFVDGQHCDETGKGRTTEVVFSCCENDQSEIARQAKEESEEVYIRSIKEPAVCSYLLQVCAKQLCETAPKRRCKGKLSPLNSTAASARSLQSFYGLIWPNLVAEDADELYWVRNIQLRTSLAQPGGIV